MLNLNKFEIDNTVEVPTSKIKIKVKNVVKRNISGKSNKRKSQFGKISNKMRKRLQHVDKHHLDEAIFTIQNGKLYKSRLTKRLNTIPEICRNCNNCIRAINFCSVLNLSCSTLSLKECSLKLEINE